MVTKTPRDSLIKLMGASSSVIGSHHGDHDRRCHPTAREAGLTELARAHAGDMRLHLVLSSGGGRGRAALADGSEGSWVRPSS